MERPDANVWAAASSSGGRRDWLRRRTPAYIARRFGKLLTRYGLSPERAKRRTWRLVDLLGRYGCAPTLATPGTVVAKHAAFARELHDAGVELAVHGFEHVDFRSLTAGDALREFTRSAAAYRDAGVSFAGFRCPYLSYSHEMQGFVPAGMFSYSSNEAVWWDLPGLLGPGSAQTSIFHQLAGFYQARPAGEVLVLPRAVDGLLEIPVSLPDDLQLLDGLRRGEDGVAEAWIEILQLSHERGSIFTVLMHPETFDLCAGALQRLLSEARALDPPVWIARLSDVAAWWRELGGFSAHVEGATIELDCTPRATLLARGFADGGASWAGGYRVLDSRTIPYPDGRLPFVGADEGVPRERVAALRELGYIVEHGGEAERCAVRLDPHAVRQTPDDHRLVELLESMEGPLVRFWHWPEKARSALSITGDLDALSLLDYASRLT